MAQSDEIDPHLAFRRQTIATDLAALRFDMAAHHLRFVLTQKADAIHDRPFDEGPDRT